MTDGFSATAERYYDLQESAETERNMIFENDERRRERREATLRSKRNKSSHYATKKSSSFVKNLYELQSQLK